MAERESNPSATLGTVLSWIGFLWLGFAVLWGMGAIDMLGFSGSLASAIGSTVFPAIILIGIGRALRRRALASGETIRPDVSQVPGATPPIIPETRPRYDPPRPTTPAAPPKPAPTPPPPPKPVVAEPAEAVLPDDQGLRSEPGQDPGLTPSAPKTSQELIEEARRRWGTRP
ncbi:MAG TPA: hypothetical protein VFL72_03875 [Acidimicrobiia bacterium]|nr:hypothetical protein [Acidimicrobiia bacterium]